VFSDALASYSDLGRDYTHQVIDHAESYVRGKVHTNGLENFWSLVKRGIKGTYVSVEPFHLFRLPGRASLPVQYPEDQRCRPLRPGPSAHRGQAAHLQGTDRRRDARRASHDVTVGCDHGSEGGSDEGSRAAP
jgi:hypothetical protein